MDKLNQVDKIEAFLSQQGWPVTRIAPSVLKSNFRGSHSAFPLAVQIEDSWIKLMVVPMARMPTDASKAEILYERLLRLNREIRLARFSLDEDGDVLLSVEFPGGELDPSEIKDALDVLSFYAEKHQPEIKRIVM